MYNNSSPAELGDFGVLPLCPPLIRRVVDRLLHLVHHIVWTGLFLRVETLERDELVQIPI